MNRQTTITLYSLGSILLAAPLARADGPLVYHRIDIASYRDITCDADSVTAHASSLLDSREFVYGR